MNLTLRDRWMLDQDWADARNFVNQTAPEILVRLGHFLSRDDAAEIVAWMKADDQIADVVTRLALLALSEATARCIDANADHQ